MPYAGFKDKINLLRVIDIEERDRNQLIEQGFGDLLHHPSCQILSSSMAKDYINLDLERNDPLRASQIQFKFLAYKTPLSANINDWPKKFYFQLRFFTFQPVMTDYLQVHYGHGSGITNENQPLINGQSYFLVKSNIAKQMQEGGSQNLHENVVHATFDIDPSLSMIDYEHVMLAEYLKERYVTIDIFESETKFYFGSCKIPLFEVLR